MSRINIIYAGVIMLDIIGDDITHLYYSIDLASYVSWSEIPGVRRAFECNKIREDFEQMDRKFSLIVTFIPK